MSSTLNFSSHCPEFHTASEQTNKIVEFQKIECDNFYLVFDHDFSMCVCLLSFYIETRISGRFLPEINRTELIIIKNMSNLSNPSATEHDN